MSKRFWWKSGFFAIFEKKEEIQDFPGSSSIFLCSFFVIFSPN